MTSKLVDRLSRLEGARRAANAIAEPMPAWLAGVYVKAIAIGLGGYPRPPQVAPSNRVDSLNDGFARALGFADEGDMDAELSADPTQWPDRMKATEAALAKRYLNQQTVDDLGGMMGMVKGVLDEWRKAKAAKPPGTPHHWPSDEPYPDPRALGVRAALAWFGATTPEHIREACGCRPA